MRVHNHLKALVVAALATAGTASPASAGPNSFKLHGAVSWGQLTATYVQVEVLDIDNGQFTAVNSTGNDVKIKHKGASASYTIDITDGTNLIVFVKVSTCASGDPECGMGSPGTQLRYTSTLLNAKNGGKQDFDLKVGSTGYRVFPVCGDITTPGATIVSGTTTIGSGASIVNGNIDWSTSVAVTGGEYCANVLQGFARQVIALDVAGCSQSVGADGFYPLGMVDAPLLDNDLEIAVSTGQAGSISGSITGTETLFPSSDPATSHFTFGDRGFIYDCQGGTQFGVSYGNPFTLAHPSSLDERLTPGEWTVMSSVRSFGPLQFGYLFPPVAVTLAPAASEVVHVALGAPAVLEGVVDYAGWALDPSSLAEVYATTATDLGIGDSRADITSFPAGVPVKLIVDSAASEWASDVELNAFASYDHGDSGFSSLAVTIETPLQLPIAAGSHAVPGISELDFTVGHLTVDGEGAAFAEWGSATPDFLIQANAFGGADGFAATLAPGSYTGVIWSHPDLPSFEVEMGAGDVEHRNYSGPLVRDLEPQPGTISGPTVTVSATVTDLDGVASVTIAGQPVTVNPDGSVQATVAASSQVTIVATDALGNQTTHTRSFEVIP